MCYEMRRFEKRTEERKRLQKKQETSPTAKDQPEIHANGISSKDKKTAES